MPKHRLSVTQTAFFGQTGFGETRLSPVSPESPLWEGHVYKFTKKHRGCKRCIKMAILALVTVVTVVTTKPRPIKICIKLCDSKVVTLVTLVTETLYFPSHYRRAATLQRGPPPYQTPPAVRQSHRPGGTAEPQPKTTT